MEVSIVSLSQELSLEDGETSNIVTLRLPDGTLVSALVNETAAMCITRAFVSSGSAAARAAAAHAAAVPDMPVPRAEQEQRSEQSVQGQHYPMKLADAGNGDLVFGEASDGSDYLTEPMDGLTEVARNFAAAESQVAHALGDTSGMSPAALKQAVQALRGGDSMPVPASMSSKRTLRVTADERGNPVIVGSGLVDHAALLGGSDVEDGDTGQL